MSESVLITGGLGYVGGRIALALADQGRWQLRLTSRDPSDPPSVLRDKAEIVSLDLLTGDQVKEVCRGIGTVIHLAAQNEVDAVSKPHEALLINGLGTLKLLEAARSAGVQRFIYFSTAHVYGAPLTGRITEETLTRPVHPYAITHRTAEDYVLAARDQEILDGIVLRLSNGFGCPAHAQVNRWTLIVNDLCRQAAATRSLVLRTHGCQWRDFITLSDVARTVVHFLAGRLFDSHNGLFNLGGECSLRVIDMAERIAARCEQVLGYRPQIHRPAPPEGESFPGIDYRIDKLKSTGVTLQKNLDAEIDATLRLCAEFPSV